MVYLGVIVKHARRWVGRLRSLGRRENRKDVIHFYDQYGPHYSFTNFSDHPVLYRGLLYPTNEHLFQAMKFMEKRPNIAEHIRTSQPVGEAIELARIHQQHIVHTWYQHRIGRMDEIIRLKFTQHKDLIPELRETGNKELIFDSPDAFWGNGAARNGRNEFGKALMRFRDTLG